MSNDNDGSKISSQQERWLAQQTAKWQQAGIISSEQQAQIQAHYRGEEAELSSTEPSAFEPSAQGQGAYPQPAESNSVWATGLLVALGALLIGGGIILLFAHNWEHLGKSTRTVFSFLPLVLSQLLCLFVYRKKFSSVAWREAAATLVFMAIAASIGLIGQTYHIYGDLERFVLSWLILGLPLVYLMRSNLVLILCSVLIVWLCTFQGKTYWLFFISLVPYWIFSFRQDLNATFYWSTWLAALGFAIALMISAVWRESLISFYPLICLLLMASVYYMAGKLLFGFDEHGFWKNPLASLGAIGIGGFSLLLSNNGYGFDWYYRTRPLAEGFKNYLDAGLLLIALAFLIFALVRYRKSLQLYQWMLAAIGLVALFALLDFAQLLLLLPWLSIFMNLFILITASLIIVRAVEQGRALLLNAGLLWLSGLILLRFFDSDFSILIKGIAFIVIGSAFIGVNVWFNRQHRIKMPATGAAYD